MEKFILGLIFTIPLVFTNPTSSNPIDYEQRQEFIALDAPQPLHTQSRFETKEDSKVTKIEKNIVYKNDSELELGEEKVIEEGEDGKKNIIYKITFFEGKEYEREVISTEVIEPKDKIIAKGTKIVWRDLATADGNIKYWKKLRVWAT